ncbi:transcriptional regulator [Microcystis phage Mwe-JY26]
MLTEAATRKATMKKAISTIGERIRHAREEKEMSQLDVSNLLGLSRAAVAQWESNTTSPSLFKTVEVAKILGVSPEWLAFGINQSAQPESEDTVRLPEIIFDNGEKPTTIPGAWSLPRDWLRGDLRCLSMEKLVVWRVEGSNMAPSYEEGDRVIVDTLASRPSPGGVFLHWDGVGPVLNAIVVRPVEGKPRAIVSSLDSATPSFEAEIESLHIIGRVRGVMKAV